MSYIIPRNILAAVTLSAAKKDVRRHLRAVYLDPQGFAVATDGNVLAYGKLRIDGEVCPALLAIDDVNFLLKMYSYQTEFAVDVTSTTWTCNDRTAQLVDGTFPDWRRVVPRVVSGVAANYDTELQSLATKVRKAYGPTRNPGLIKLFQNGTDAGVYRIGDDLHLVIMPLRHTYAGEYAPLI